MTASSALRFFKSGAFLYNRRFALTVWFGLALIGVISQIIPDKLNIYEIYKFSFYHIQAEKPLYPFYPQEYGDQFMYGPVFTLLIAPFAVLPDKLAVVLWVLLNAGALFYAVRRLPIHPAWQCAVLVCCSHEILLHSQWLQVNALSAAFLIIAFCDVLEGKEPRALFMILLGAFIKVYSILGLGFFLFSRRKGAFILWAAVWTVVFFFAPLLLTSWKFLLQTYQEWFVALKVKNAHNVDLTNGYLYQDISAMGMVRRITGYNGLKNAYFLVPAAVLFLTQFVRFYDWKDTRYRLYILCSMLLMTVVFSSGAESPTYIIALPAICIWYFIQRKTPCVTAYFIFALLLTTFAYSDLFTPWFRNNVMRPYSLKALPSTLTWVIILVQIHLRQYLRALPPGSGPKLLHPQNHEPAIHSA